MHISKSKLEDLMHSRGFTLKELLRRTQVSKTAYYHLLYKDTVLPKSIHSLSNVLNVRPSAFLEEMSPEEKKIRQIAKRTEQIMAENPGLNRENVRHTLILLQEEPVTRLRRGLIRGR
ncbi:MAG: hypothetical protein ACOC6P_04460 [Candidatus Aminicenantaceae bacterium]